MARGTAAGEPVVSQAQTKEFDEGYDRIFGERKPPERGRFIYDPQLGRCVPAAEYHAPRAVDAPICAGRFYENTCTVDGVDIGSRQKRREYMEKNGLVDPSDFKEHLAEKAKERERFYREGFATPQDEKRERQAAERALGEIVEMRQKDYDRVRARRAAEREKRGKGFEY